MLKMVKLLPKIDINNINKIQIIIIAGIEAIAHLTIKITIEENGILKSLIATFCSFFSLNISPFNKLKILFLFVQIYLNHFSIFEIKFLNLYLIR